MTDLATLGIRIDSSQANRAAADLSTLSRSAQAAERATTQYSSGVRRAETATSQMSREVQRAQQQMRLFETSLTTVAARAGAIFGAAFSVGKIIEYADAWTVAGNKIAAAGVIAGRAGRDLEGIKDIANRTRSDLTSTADLYAKLLRSTADVAKSEKEVAQATEIVAKAFKAGGAAASEQAAGILQLAQALGSGVLQGDELRSVRENAPLLAKAIADAFGTTVAGLKDLGAEGELTVDRIFAAILKAGPEIEKAFGVTQSTFGEFFTRVGNEAIAFVGKLNENFSTIAKGAAVAGAALTLAFSPAVFSGIAAGFSLIGSTAATAFGAIALAVAANPISALAAVIGAAASALILFKDEIFGVSGANRDYAETQELVNELLGKSVPATESAASATSRARQETILKTKADLEAVEALALKARAEANLAENLSDFSAINADGSLAKERQARAEEVTRIEKAAGILRGKLYDISTEARNTEAAFGEVGKRVATFAELAAKGFGAVETKSSGASSAAKKLASDLSAAADALLTTSEKTERAALEQVESLVKYQGELKTTKSALSELETALASATNKGNIQALFGDVSNIRGAQAAIEEAARSVDDLFARFDRNQSIRSLMNGLDDVRKMLEATGLGKDKIDAFVNALVQAQIEAEKLRNKAHDLDATIQAIKDKTINIRTVYTVQSVGGGTTDIGVTRLQGATNYYQGPNAFAGQTGTVAPAKQINVQDYLAGAKASGGPVSEGMTYLVGEQGPELVKMPGSGNVSTASATASILSGGSNVLRSIEENTFLTVEEVRRAVSYLETISNDWQATLAVLKGIQSALSSVRASGGMSSGGYSSGGGGYSSGGGSGAYSYSDPYAPYVWNRALQPGGGAGMGGIPYDPVADYLLNGNKSALSAINRGSVNIGLEAGAGSIGPWSIANQRDQFVRQLAGFDSGGYIHPGDTQEVSFFKNPRESVGIFRPEQVDAIGEAMTPPARSERPINLTVHYNIAPGAQEPSPASRYEMEDRFKRAVRSVMAST